jgi:hypothetical protein
VVSVETIRFHERDGLVAEPPRRLASANEYEQLTGTEHTNGPFYDPGSGNEPRLVLHAEKVIAMVYHST